MGGGGYGVIGIFIQLICISSGLLTVSFHFGDFQAHFKNFGRTLFISLNLIYICCDQPGLTLIIPAGGLRALPSVKKGGSQ